MNTFYIARHGQTENNKAQRFSGWIDTPLTEAGVQNALSTAAKLQGIPIDIIISSDLGRAFITAYIVAQTNGYSAEIVRLSGLREINYGELANMPYSSYPHMAPLENASFVNPGGESLLQMQARVLGCIQHVNSDNSDKAALIVGHDGTINAIRASCTGENVGTADTYHNAHDYVARFTMEADKVTSFKEVFVA